ncbi:hypothetical protein GGX14DRAFT_570313 [Mycena pura]|uniref:Uncharacterized protein n=1 Tax=Mycena pura TaxID=153505 RepID=A0AAD6V5F3_9AGAR|nr:hypothetical protein GGX14DRAFT_570313 [Mycena pura]
MSHFPIPRFDVNGEPIIFSPRRRSSQGVFTVHISIDPEFPPRQRAQEVQSTAPAPSAQNPATRSVAAAPQMPPPFAIPRSDYLSRRPVAQSTALSSPPAAGLPSDFPSHRPAFLKDAVSEAAQIVQAGYRWRASSPSCRVRADQVAPPRADATDAWHNTSEMLFYLCDKSFNTEVPITITFAPTHGPGLVGVAMTELARGRGVLEPQTPIGNFFLPKFQWAGATGRLVIELPGYPTMQTFRLVLQDENGRYTPRAAFGTQIARAVANFADSDPFRPGPGRLPLGRHRDGASYEQMRLLEAISFNGQDFYLRFALVPGSIPGSMTA